MTYQSFVEESARLNAQQKLAVFHPSGPVLVIAGAGSGKTRVATLRIAHTLHSGACPSSVVAVTFTNKAAREMRERVQALVGSEVLVSTFHSLGARILRESIHHLGYPQNFVIYAESESEKILKACVKEAFASCSESDFTRLQRMISSSKDSPQAAPKDPALLSLFESYQQRLRQSGAVDFDDLIYLPVLLFQKFPEVLRQYQERWQHLLVDEYQDTSSGQGMFARSLAGTRQNIFAVGDPDQSIYSWRGAKIQNILSFQEQFPGASIVRLEQNYRSTNTILGASNSVIQCNDGRIDKQLWSSRGNGEPITLHIGESERQEAEFVATTIKDLGLSGIEYGQIAILYRTNAQSRPFEDRFLQGNIPYTMWGGTPFYARKEVRDILSFLQIALVPQDTISFARALRLVAHGFGDVSLRKLFDQASNANRPVYEVALDAVQGLLSLNATQKAGLGRFCQVISLLKQKLAANSAYDLVSSAIHDSGYEEVLQKDAETAAERKENLEQLLSRAKEWDEFHDQDDSQVCSFLEELVLEGSRNQAEDQTQFVTLSTIHNAKGLEFPIVFLVGLEEDLFPHINSKNGPEAKIEEERRLFYVGMTRAKDKLFLTASRSRMIFGAMRRLPISRFLKEVPKKFVQASWLDRSGDSAPAPAVPQKSFFPNTQASIAPLSERRAPIQQEQDVFFVGQKIIHPQFGIGRIECIKESSIGKMYEVFFSSDQTKRRIVAQHSPMKPLDHPLKAQQ